MDAALLIIRVVVGAYVFGHGAQKLFGWFGGRGLNATSQTFGDALRFRPARFWALAAGLSEGAGALLFLGLLTPLASAAVVAAMAKAILSSHLGKGWFAATRGPELPLTFLAVALAVALAGPGRYSVDHALGIIFPVPATPAILAVLVVVGIVIAFASRRSAGAAPLAESV